MALVYLQKLLNITESEGNIPQLRRTDNFGNILVCVPGQGDSQSKIKESSHNTKPSCQRQCVRTESCAGFDFAPKISETACRLFKTKSPLDTSPGSKTNRLFCSMVVGAVAAVGATASTGKATAAPAAANLDNDDLELAPSRDSSMVLFVVGDWGAHPGNVILAR